MDEHLFKRPSSPARVSRGSQGSTYTRLVMSQQKAINRMFRSLQGGSSLVEPRCAMSEVQICGIPKLDAGEVASTA
jgi:hypothetical protein